MRVLGMILAGFWFWTQGFFSDIQEFDQGCCAINKIRAGLCEVNKNPPRGARLKLQV